jgi:hypothetical protein
MTTPTKNKTYIGPLYTVNQTFSRKMGIYRATFLMGGLIAPVATLRKHGIDVDADDQGISRLYHNSLKYIGANASRWLALNREQA